MAGWPFVRGIYNSLILSTYWILWSNEKQPLFRVCSNWSLTLLIADVVMHITLGPAPYTVMLQLLMLYHILSWYTTISMQWRQPTEHTTRPVRSVRGCWFSGCAATFFSWPAERPRCDIHGGLISERQSSMNKSSDSSRTIQACC